MRLCYSFVSAAASLVAGLLVAGPSAGADPVKPADSSRGAQRLVIHNGSTRSVHYFTDGMSRGDRAILRDMERAENEVAAADQLQSLKLQYVRDEAILQRARRQAQEQLYGAVNSYATGVYPDQLYAIDSQIPFARRSLFNSNFNGFGGFSDSFGLPGVSAGLPGVALGYPGVGAPLATLSVDEGRFKTELVRTLATQNTPENIARVHRNYDVAMDRAGRSDTLRAALNLPRPKDGQGQPVAGESSTVVTLKSGRTIEGNIAKEDDTRVILNTPGGQMEIRKDSVETIYRRGGTK